MTLIKALPLDFQKQFAAWVRLEPRCRSNDWAKGLQARTADPLWMLARQWQTGEFQGEDAGSPIKVQLEYSTLKLDRIRLGDKGTKTDLPNAPLEAVVEQERFEMNWRVRVQAGQQFERFARAELGNAAQVLIKAYREIYPIKPPASDSQAWIDTDHAARRYIAFMAGRVIDGKALSQAIDQNQLTPPSDITKDRLQQVIDKFDKWRLALHLQPSGRKSEAWRNQQLDYNFELHPPKEPERNKTQLKASDYRNGNLDWQTFSMKNYDEKDKSWKKEQSIVTHPTRVSVGGTSPRWWAFEDGATDFGKLDVAKPDLAKLLLMEFVLIYGDDWFSVPVPIQTAELLNEGTELQVYPKLVKIDSLKVYNVFGEEVSVPSARKPTIDPLQRWEMFTLSGTDNPRAPAPSNVLFVPPVTGFREESSPIEEVRFLRDEGANMVWGVENLIPNGLGKPIDGFDAQHERAERRTEAEIERLENNGLTDEERESLKADPEWVRKRIALLRDGPRPTSGGVPRYRLATTVPENWIPFVPTNASSSLNLADKSIRLRRAKMLRNADAEEPEEISAMSRILDLSDEPLLWLEEATVPRAGLRVQLTAQRVRWVDGKTYVWLGRKVTVGRSEGSSGLKSDIIKFGENNADG